MKRLLFVLLFAASTLLAQAQLHIPNTRVSFDFPDGGWKYLKTINVDKNTTVYLYSYVHTSDDDNLPPFMRIFVRTNYTDDIYMLAYTRYTQQPFQSINEYTDGLPADDGIGYIGAYTNHENNNDYQFRMIYFKDRSTAFEVRLECDRKLFDQMDGTFEKILNTIKIEK
ncbi:MAG: hypothetical protein KBT04_05580 [Bacteroidales bacterium]|nr:hypothetical protein [Candidatus Colimorpha onthohippi]